MNGPHHPRIARLVQGSSGANVALRRRGWFRISCELLAWLTLITSIDGAIFSARSLANESSRTATHQSTTILAGIFATPLAWLTSFRQSTAVVASLPAPMAQVDAPQGGAGTVHWVAPSGACGGRVPCTSSIQAAIDEAAPGDTVRVLPGEYREQLRIRRKNAASASEADRIVIEADPEAAVGSVILKGRNARCEGGYSVDFDRSRFVTLRGLTVVGAGARGVGLRGGSRQNESITIERNRILRGGPTECNGGIDVGRGNPDTLIINNLIYGNGRNGIRFRDGRGGSYRVISNTIVRNDWNGIQLARAAVADLVNNIIAFNGLGGGAGSGGVRHGVRRLAGGNQRGADVRLLGNLICGNRDGELLGNLLDDADAANQTPSGEEGHGVVASVGCPLEDRLFAGLAGGDGVLDTEDDDFRLVEESPAIDLGVDPRGILLPTVSNEQLAADYLAQSARPRGEGFDIGAIEFGRPRPTPTATPAPSPEPTASLAPTPSPSSAPTPAEHAPEIVSQAQTHAGTRYLYRYPVEAVDPDAGDVLAFVLEAGPVGMSIDETSGVIEWMPGDGDQGQHSVRLRVQDRTGLFDRQEFEVQVDNAPNRSPVITSTPLPLVVLVASSGDPAPVDLTDWTYIQSTAAGGQGAAQWVVDPTGRSVTQVRNADPSFFVSDFHLRNEVIEGTWRVGNDGDDDLIGFVFGYQDPHNFYLFDWKRGTQGGCGAAAFVGMTVKKVAATPPLSCADLWATGGSPQVSSLYHNSLPWARDVDYKFRLHSDAGRFSIRVTQGETVLDDILVIDESFVSGNFGFYNNSQGLVTYSGFFLRPIVDGTYLYELLAVDPDGDPVTFALVSAPLGVTIDPKTGVLRWPLTGRDLGDHEIAISASDGRGGTTEQWFVVSVEKDADGDGHAAPGSDCDDDNGGAYPGASETPGNGIDEDCDGQDTLGPLDIDDDGDGAAERQGDCDDTNPGIGPNVTDIPGNGIDENCDGRDATPPPASIEVRPATATLVTNQVQAYQAIATLDDGTTVDVTPEVTWQTSPAGVITIDAQGVGVATAPGPAAITAEKDGVTGAASVTVLARVADDVPPTVAITSPVVDATVGAPVGVVGTADDTNFLRYELELAPENSEDFQVIAEGASPVVNGVLGTLDPTMLSNGVYRVRLRAYDLGGNTSTAQTRVSVVGELKLGNFRLSFTDLTIPVAGIPISIIRTYDSLDTRPGDFGAGWNLGYPGRIEDSASESPNAPFTDATRVYVTKPDGRRIGFTFQASCSFFGCASGFRPDPGVHDRLEVASAPGALFRSGGSYYAFSTAFNPRTYVLTTKERVKYTLDEIDGLVRIEDANGNTLDFTETAITSSTGVAVTLERDAAGRITRVTEPDPGDGREPGVLEYVYDARGNLVSFFDQLDHETKYTYGQGQYPHYLTRIEDPLGRPTVRNVYDGEGRLVALCDFNGQVTPPAYPGCTRFTPNAGAREQTIINAKGHKTSLVLDARGNVLSERRFIDGGTVLETHRTYDSGDNLLTETDPEGNVKLYSYDTRGNQLTSTEGGRTTTRTYNVCNKVLTETDPGGNTTTTAYDATGCLARFVTNALGHTTEYRYDDHDAPGQVSDFIEANGVHWRWDYDSRGFLASMELVTDPAPGVQQTTYQFSGAGDLLSQTDRKGQTITLTYDEAHRVRTETWDTTPPRVTTYNYNQLGQLTSAVDPDSSLTIGYDNQGRVQTVDNGGTPGAPQVIITYGYDANGNVASVADSLGGVTIYEYDALDRLEMITQEGAGGSERRVDLKYDGASLLRELRRFSDIVGTQGVADTFYDYDCGGCAGRLTRIHHRKAADNSVIHDLDFVRDAVGNITQMSDAEGLHTFTYGAIRQLLTATHPMGGAQPDEFYEYDSVGNRTLSHLSSSYVYEPGTNRLLQEDQSRYAYDPNGNLVAITWSDVEVAFFYDYRNRLVRVVRQARAESQAEESIFTYDVADRRIAMKSGVLSQTIVYDKKNPLLVLDSDGLRRRLYGRVLDGLYGEESEISQWFLLDQVGSVRDSILSDAASLAHLGYDSFGQSLIVDGNVDATVFGFQAREFDRARLLGSFRARSYFPAQGRFGAEDPLAGFGYSFGDNNPLVNRDPTGLKVVTETAALLLTARYFVSFAACGYGLTQNGSARQFGGCLALAQGSFVYGLVAATPAPLAFFTLLVAIQIALGVAP